MAVFMKIEFIKPSSNRPRNYEPFFAGVTMCANMPCGTLNDGIIFPSVDYLAIHQKQTSYIPVLFLLGTCLDFELIKLFHFVIAFVRAIRNW